MGLFVSIARLAIHSNYMLTLLRNAEMLDLVKDDPSMPDENATVEYMLKNLCIVGDKKSCMEQFEELWDVTGGFGTLLFVKHDFDDAERWNSCMHVLAEEIVPALPTVGEAVSGLSSKLAVRTGT